MKELEEITAILGPRLDKLSLADLQIIKNEIDRGVLPRTDEIFTLRICVSEQISHRIMNLVRTRPPE